MMPVLIVPGIGNSGPTHWQTQWEQRHPGLTRVVQRDWDQPVSAEWVATLDAALQRHGPAIVVAHSLGCLVVAQWLAQWAARRPANAMPALRGVLMVAVPDPHGPSFPPQAQGFGALPTGRLPGPLTVVSSSDDPYAPSAFTARCVADWGAEHVHLGAAGHINAASGLADWPQGWALVERWRPA